VVANPHTPTLVGQVGDRYPDILRAFEEVAVRATGVAEPDDLHELLQLVGRRTCELLDVGRFSAFIRGEDGLFYGQVGYSRTADDITEGVQRLITGTDTFTEEIVAAQAPVLVTDATTNPLSGTAQRTLRRWAVRDMLGVPLVFSGEVIGIVYLDNEDQEHVYTGDEVQVAQVFASLSALAIRQAWLYAQLSRRALVIDRQRRVLEQTAEAHRQLTETAVRGADVPETLRVLAGLLNKPVLFLTSDFEVAADALPPGAEAHGAVCRGAAAHLSRMFREARPFGAAAILPAAPHLDLPYRQLICPLMADERAMGHLGVLEVGSRIRPVDVKIAEQGATVLALLVISERRQMEAEGQAREDFLTDLLHGARDPAVLNRRAPLFGLDLDRRHVVVRFALDPDPGLPARARRSLVSSRLTAALGGDDVLAVTVPGADVVLAALPDGPEPDAVRQVRQAVEQVLDEIASEVPLQGAAISPVLRRVEDYPRAHRELRSLLEATLVITADRPRVVLAGELGIMRLVLAGTSAESRQFAQDLLGPLMAHDTETQSELLNTLRSYLECGAQVRATARALSVHENTVRYRLSRVAEVSGIDPNDIGGLLDARFAIQILDLTGRPEPPPRL
jgi:sugar diacid utilization regulator